jgi:hypothetical protein
MALTDNLISFWELEEASGTRVDAVTATGNDLTDHNTVGSTTGKVGNAAVFVEADQHYLSHVDNASLSTGDIDFSFSAWIYLTDLSPTEPFLDVVCKSNGTTYEYELAWTKATNRVSFYVEGPSFVNATVIASNFGNLSAATWYHVVAWHDSVNDIIGIRINDSQTNTVSYSSGSKDTSYTFCMSSTNGGFAFWNGRIDQVGFWKKVLSAGEITQLYNGGAGLSYAAMQAFHARYYYDQLIGNVRNA